MIRNIHFTLLISIGKQQHEFNFRKRSLELYDGDTADERGNRHYFKMIKENHTWKIQGSGLPGWITVNEKLIIDAMDKQENS